MARNNDFSVMLSSILLIIAFFTILLTTGDPSGGVILDKPSLSELDRDDISICQGVGGKAYIIGNQETANGVEIRCDLSEYDNQLL